MIVSKPVNFSDILRAAEGEKCPACKRTKLRRRDIREKYTEIFCPRDEECGFAVYGDFG